MVLNTNLISFDEVVREVESNSLDNFEQFIRWVDSRMMINPAAGEVLREVHEAVNTSVHERRSDALQAFPPPGVHQTLEQMGNMPDTASVAESCCGRDHADRRSVRAGPVAQAARALILCLSDKPDEASKSSSRYAVDMPPLHRAETHRIGVSILDTLSHF